LNTNLEGPEALGEHPGYRWYEAVDGWFFLGSVNQADALVILRGWLRKKSYDPDSIQRGGGNDDGDDDGDDDEKDSTASFVRSLKNLEILKS